MDADQIQVRHDADGNPRLIVKPKSLRVVYRKQSLSECLKSKKIILFILLIVCITIHEWAHAWVADKLGDPLPRQQGRVTLDPRSHVDPWGTLVIPLVMIFANPGFQ